MRSKNVKIKSPITHSDNTVEIYEFDNNKLKSGYGELGIDISRFVDYKIIQLIECQDTGYRFYYPNDIFGDGPFYEELQTKLPWYYKEGKFEHEQALKNITESAKVLEIGSGSGHFLELCKQKNINATGLELNEKAIRESEQKAIQVYKSTIQEFAINQQSEFDVVCFFQVLEHIYDVKSFLNAAINCLKPGGKLIIAVPNNNPFIFRYDVYHTLNLPPHHAGLWNKGVFEKLPKYFPLKLEQVHIEPMTEYKTWFLVQKEHFRKDNKLKWFLLTLIPRPVYKTVLKLFRSRIEGRNIFVVYTKL